MLARALLDALPQTLLPRVGVGHGKFPALVAARSSEPLGLTKVSEDAAAFLSSAPSDCCRHPRIPYPCCAGSACIPWARSQP